MTDEHIPDPERTGLAFGLFIGGILAGALIVLLGPLLWIAVTGLGGTDEQEAATQPTTQLSSGHEDHEHRSELWTCPMHPFVESDRFGACPVCGMDLVLRTSSTGLDPAELAAIGRVAVSPVERVLANVATVPIGRADLTIDIRAFGRLVYDETSLATIPAWVSGRVERLFVEETGTDVERGQRLLSIYSPELLAAQEEYLVILRSTGFTENLSGPAERRLRLLGMSSRQIRRLAERGETSDTMTVYAPAAGTITERLVQEGEYVREGQPLFRLAGEQNIWVEADVFEREVSFVNEGMQAEVELLSFPGESYSGIVTLVWPFLDEATRTLRVRVEFESVDERFRAGMYATVHLSAEMIHQTLAVPTESVIRTGDRAVVYVEIEENLFERRAVNLGYRSGDLFEVLSGVEAGENVVARGGFLIDSEAQLHSGGRSLHFDHVAEEQGTLAETRVGELDQLPLGRYFCPIDPSENGAEPGRCSSNNMSWVERTADSTFDPHADPISLVRPNEWYCPMGAEWVADEAGRCPICGMFLVEMPENHTGH